MAYIDTNTDLRKKGKNVFEKYFSIFIINAGFEIATKIVRKHKDIKLVPTERRRNYLLPESDYLTTKFITEKIVKTYG